MAFSLAPECRIGEVSLTITNLKRSVEYYQKLGLTLHRQEEDGAWLGDGKADLLILHENPNARTVSRTTGLYHFAILVPTRLDLALAFKNMVDQQIPIGGYSDHLVSEAIYLSDPDGNGIEVYADRPREVWEYALSGQVRIDTVPLDLQDLLGELANDNVGWQGFPEGTTMGHVHLHVADLEEAGRFYTEVLGFDFVVKYGRSAYFLSVGGYHHHIGMNTWAGVGIPHAAADSVGLRYYSLILPNEEAKSDLISNLQKHNVALDTLDGDPIFEDPAGNHIRVEVEKILMGA